MVSGDAVARVLAALDFVEERLTCPICVGDMAEAAGYSLFHFIRLFNTVAWHSPYDYAMRRKIGLSSKRVLAGGESLLEIALDFGFETPEGFARAFSRVFGVNPSEARKAGRVDSRRITPVPDACMLDVLSRCRRGKTTYFENDILLNVRIVTSERPSDGIERAVDETEDASWIGVVYGAALDGGPQIFVGPGGPFRTELTAGSWFEVVHQGPPSDLPAMTDLADFAFRTTFGIKVPPDWIVLHREDLRTRILIRACGED